MAIHLSRRAILSASAAAAATLAFGRQAHADDQPIKIVVGFSPGGTTDVLARMVADGMGTKLGRTIIVENRPGASGNIAAQMVANGAPDGKTLLFAPSSHATNASLYRKLPFDTANDFASVGLVASTPYVLMINPQVPAKAVPELIALLKAQPRGYQYASAGQGTGQHLAGELFKRMAGVDMVQVPYKGSSAAFPDLVAGRVPIMFDNIALMLPHIRSGTPLRPLAITSAKRSPELPEVPTVAETLPGYEVLGWFALLAQARTPSQVVQEYNTALDAAVGDPAFEQKLSKIGAEAMTATPAEAEKYIRQEIARWGDLIRQSNIALD
jgi:tripartite-type tricarboxylate transporter receptor subunit TctC